MTRNEIIDKLLREAGVSPPSAIGRSYGDKVWLPRAEIIVRSLDETGMLSLPEGDPLFSEKISRMSAIVAGLQRRLPDDYILTCTAFRDYGAACCGVCHADPLHGMRLAELAGGSWAWLCCSVDAASSPVPLARLHGREEGSQ